MPRSVPRALALAAALAAAPAAAQVVPESAVQMQLSFAPLVRKAAPAVVNIYATTFVDNGASPYADDPMLSQLLRQLQDDNPSAEAENSLGSGVILSPDGLVVSNYHVVGEADEIVVVLSDRREYQAQIVLKDEESDLAVMRLQGARDLPVLPLADSDRAEVGELVLAIGNPFGVGQTVSSGIISGLGRSTLSEGSERGYFLQTDAPINPGNSGGALINMAGELVGINTAILTRDGGSDGVGFAIPSNLVAAVMAQAQAGAATFARPWVGLSGQSVDGRTAEALGMDRPQGMLVTDLDPGSPFAVAGISPGDVILAIDGLPVYTPPEVEFRLAVAGADDALTVAYMRDGFAAETSVNLTAAADPGSSSATVGDGPLQGLDVAALNDELRADLRLPRGLAGVVVTAARDGAFGGGLRPGDLIIGVNGAAVESPADVVAAARSREITVEIMRRGRWVQLEF